MKPKPKLSKEKMRSIWDASKPNVYKNKTKYTRKGKARFTPFTPED